MSEAQNEMNGGRLVAEVLEAHGVKQLYALCGGHISPILIESEKLGIRVIDTRHEVTAVFAADATARLTGIPGVAAVTAGPGLTNTITAVKNAQMAQSPLVVLGGATATLLKGRGSLQDIDQLSLMKPHVKWMKACKKVREIVPALEEAFAVAQDGVPGPVFVEFPVDLLYPESIVQQWTANSMGKGTSIQSRATNAYINNHVRGVFSNAWKRRAKKVFPPELPFPSAELIEKVQTTLETASRPVLIVGSQAMLTPSKAEALQQSVLTLGIPTFLSGMARGLLGHNDLHIRHKRSNALKEADVVVLAGVPFDFRLGYGRSIPSKTTIISLNRSPEELKKNRKPTISVLADAGAFLRILAAGWNQPSDKWLTWHQSLLRRNADRDAEILEQSEMETEYVNPLYVCRMLEEVIDENSVIIGDGGDFVATASYITRPRGPLSWLDPGAFGTLGAGGGFAVGSKAVREDAEIWLLYGDGSAGYSIAEFDTYARHGLPIIAVVGTDGSWAQIAREQVEIFGTSLGTDLARTDYHIVAQGFGGIGIKVEKPEDLKDALLHAKAHAREGRPVLVNVMLGATDFRKGSISI